MAGIIRRMNEHRRIEGITDAAIEKARRTRDDAGEPSPPSMPRPRGREITPVLSLPADATVGYLELKGFEAGMTVLHAPSGVVGVVKRVHGPGEWKVGPSPRCPRCGAGFDAEGSCLRRISGSCQGGVGEAEDRTRPVSESVVELEDGNAFLFRPGSFVVLDEAARVMRGVAASFLSSWVTTTAQFAAKTGVDPDAGLAVIRSVLLAQLRALDERPRTPAEPRGAPYVALKSQYGPIRERAEEFLGVSTMRDEEARREADRHARECLMSDEVG